MFVFVDRTCAGCDRRPANLNWYPCWATGMITQVHRIFLDWDMSEWDRLLWCCLVHFDFLVVMLWFCERLLIYNKFLVSTGNCRYVRSLFLCWMCESALVSWWLDTEEPRSRWFVLEWCQLYCTARYSTGVLCCTVLYCPALYCTARYCAAVCVCVCLSVQLQADSQ